MTSSLEYHVCVRRSIPVPVALLSVLVLVLASIGHAQINGVPSSVTSPGFGGRPVNGTPPSVTSLGPNGFAPNPRVTFSTSNVPRDGDRHPHRHHRAEFAAPWVYAVPVPYAVDIGATDDDDAGADDHDANYQGGPTIFDRRGSGAASYIPPARDATAPRVAQNADPSMPDPGPPQEPTLLIFKDGRKLEVGNYAIVGATLFDLTPGHARRIALADLDLEATRQQNDDRGITFQLPPIPQAN
jgi:hypothetical protein